MKTQFSLILRLAWNVCLRLALTPSIRASMLTFGACGVHAVVHRGIQVTKVGGIRLGDNVVINSRVLLDSRKGIKIGNNVMIGQYSKIYTLGHDIESPHFEATGGSVVIEDNVVCFSNVLLMPKVTLRKGSIILSGAVVTKSTVENGVYGGNPAKLIRFVERRSDNIKYKLHYPWLFGS